jgi:hypothetical protein
MYVHMYVCMYVCTNVVCTYVQICVQNELKFNYDTPDRGRFLQHEFNTKGQFMQTFSVVCMYVCTYVCTYTCMYVCTNVQVWPPKRS